MDNGMVLSAAGLVSGGQKGKWAAMGSAEMMASFSSKPNGGDQNGQEKTDASRRVRAAAA